MPFASAFGQTFFIGVFGSELRETFGISNARFGLLYSLATLANAGLLMWLGRLIDRVDLRAYTAATVTAYSGACLFMALVPPLAPLLFLGFLFLRLTGQGLMSHIGVTSMGRYFHEGRGTAVSIASLGFPGAEALFPPLGVAMIGWLGWRQTWLVIAVVLILIVLPLALWLLRGHTQRDAAHRAQQAERTASGLGDGDWRVAQVMRDPRMYLMLPAVLLAPFAITGLFFHQAVLVEAKGWTLAWFAGAFVPYALASTAGTMVSGHLVDRIGARRLLPVFVLPIAAGLMLLATASAPWVAYGFMIGAGLTAGSALTLQGALWAEIYGTAHLGAIRSLVWGLVVFSTAIAPVLFGLLLDSGVKMNAIAGGCVAAAGLAAVLTLPVTRGAQA